MKKYVIRILAAACAVMLSFGCFGAMSCSAAVVSDGNGIYDLGDANHDNSVDIRDCVRVKRFLAGTAEMLQAAADVDGDGDVTVTDLAGLTKALIGTGSFTVDKSLWSSEIK